MKEIPSSHPFMRNRRGKRLTEGETIFSSRWMASLRRAMAKRSRISAHLHSAARSRSGMHGALSAASLPRAAPRTSRRDRSRPHLQDRRCGTAAHRAQMPVPSLVARRTRATGIHHPSPTILDPQIAPILADISCRQYAFICEIRG